jgi:hypothetical protein
MGRDWPQLARYAATRVVGLTALGGLAALGLNTFGATSAAGASKTTPKTPPVTTSANFTIDLQLSMPAHYTLDVHSTGEADFVHHDVTMSVAVPTAGLHSSDIGQGVPPAKGSIELHAEWVNGQAYLTVPTSLRALAGGAQSLSYATPASTAHEVNTAISQTAVAVTYAHILVDTLAGHAAQHHAGTKMIDGVTATGTQVDLKLAQLLKIVPGLSLAMTKDIKRMAGTEIPVTVWFDHSGRLVEATMAASSKSKLGSISGTVQFSNFNAPVTITAPPAGTVKPISKGELALLKSVNPFGGAG